MARILRIVQVSTVEKSRCPWCGADLYFNHQAFEIYHHEPACKKYLGAVASMHGTPQGQIYVIESEAVETNTKPS